MRLRAKAGLSLSAPLTTILPYANILDPDETPSKAVSHPDPSYLTYANILDPDATPSKSASRPDPSYLTLRQHFTIFEGHLSTLKIEAYEEFIRR